MNVWRIKFNDTIYVVKANTIKSALYKLYEYVSTIHCDDKVSPMIYHGLYKLGYSREQLEGKSEEEINHLYYSKKRNNAINKSISPNTSNTTHNVSLAKSIAIHKTIDRNKFSTALYYAREELKEKDISGFWRVDKQTPEELEQKHATMYISDNGGTYALKPDGDIIAVCKRGKDRGSLLIKNAISNGGDRLDSFSGNHMFYMSQGFEPVCYIKFDTDYPPEDFPKNAHRENIIFYRYTGKPMKPIKWSKLKPHIKLISGYDNNYNTAYAYRDSIIEKEKSHETDTDKGL